MRGPSRRFRASHDHPTKSAILRGPQMSDGAILRLRSVTKRFGGLTAVDDVSFDVSRGEIFALIGPNGAGKTKLFNGIKGLIPPSEGTVEFDGANITRFKPHK